MLTKEYNMMIGQKENLLLLVLILPFYNVKQIFAFGGNAKQNIHCVQKAIKTTQSSLTISSTFKPFVFGGWYIA